MVPASDSLQTVAEQFDAAKLAKTVLKSLRRHQQGQLKVFTNHGPQWTLFFYGGKLLWITASEHRFRRWHRLMSRVNISPTNLQLRNEPQPSNEDLWEISILEVLLQRGSTKLETAVNAVEIHLFEALFDLFHSADRVIQIGHTPDIKGLNPFPCPPRPDPEVLVNKSYKCLKGWQKTALQPFPMTFAPAIVSREKLLAQTSDRRSYETIVSFGTARFSIQDLCLSHRKDPLSLAQLLIPYVEKGMLNLQPLADLADPFASPKAPSTTPKASSAKTAPLILCVDDSPQIGYILEQILRPAGYRVLTLQDTCEVMSVVLRQKPDVMLLDLVMPVFSGYELCSHIRRVSAFKTTPIVFLTGSDGVVDRMRAKMVGATNFLSKPVDEVKVLALMQKYAPIAK
jgi:two-component system, chemotaxis family, response regulator PixG